MGNKYTVEVYVKRLGGNELEWLMLWQGENFFMAIFNWIKAWRGAGIVNLTYRKRKK